MNAQYRTLLERVKEEMKFVNISVIRSEKAWQKAIMNNDDSFYDSVALNLHNMYNGTERIFEMIATNIDESMPDGKTWHRDLLIQMSLTITDIRPHVISHNLMAQLDEYRSFRHIVRNIYAFQYDLEKLKKLVDQLPNFIKLLNSEIDEFCLFLKQV
jgi:hypothetical protein